ncbi:response regulator [Maribrevibacterium harenarium]|uniref:Response regulator n=1 Tax=Maribrevibacterium harenarium TaxID=2589817 RepID=A0A501WJY5_9GAMM|nr:response regulator [Maribrevibacterium harenarium]TPE47351.1 response regulator [Maribrevibacterium harenarium]
MSQLDNVAKLTTALGEYFKSTPLTIAVVDDMPLARQSLKRSMANISAKDVHLFNSAESMLSAWKSRHFDIILCDLNLPGKNGAWLLNQAKELKLMDCSDIFFMISGETRSKAINGLLTLSPDEYIIKPYNEVLLYRRLKRNLEKRDNYISLMTALKVGTHYRILLEDQLEKNRPTELGAAKSYRAVGDALLDLNMYDESLKLYRDASKRFQGTHNEWAQLGYATALNHTNNKAEAIETYTKMLTSTNNPLRIHAALAECYKDVGNMELALESAYEVFKEASHDLLIAEQVANLAKAAGKHAVAEEACYRIVRLTKRQADDIGKRLCDHLLACGEIIINGQDPIYDYSIVKRFQASLHEMRELKHVSPAELSNSYKAEIQYCVSQNKLDAASVARGRWFRLIDAGKAQAFTKAQQYTLDKLLGLYNKPALAA